MKFSYQWLKALTHMKDTPEELAEFLTLRAFEVEQIEKRGDDVSLDVKAKAFPNRIADAGGHLGLAREIALLKRLKIKNQELRIKEDKKKKTSSLIKIKVENSIECPRYTARVMTGVAVAPSPDWIREKLETCGLQTINNIVDAANYVMLETGQPLHVFDFDQLESSSAGTKTIIVRRAEQGEKITALDQHTYELHPEVLVIADEKEPLAIAGIKGGAASGVSQSTTTIILESANFNQTRIRLASQKLNLRTDASLRFEHGMDSGRTEDAVNRLAELIQQLAGGVILKGTVDCYPKKKRASAILFRPEYASRLIGETLPLSFYTQAFARLGWNIKRKGDHFIVEPPGERLDIAIEEDIIEEMARILDYRNIKPKMPQSALVSSPKNEDIFWTERVENFLVGAGFSQSLLYQFTGDQELKEFQQNTENVLELKNPTRPETKYLVPRILTKYIISAAQNLKYTDQVSIFGVGKSFRWGDGGRVNERNDLILILAKKDDPRKEAFYVMKGVVERLLEEMGISEHWYDDGRESEMYHPYRNAEINIGDQKIGIVGEINPALLASMKITTRITAAQISFDQLWPLARSETEYRPIGKYPAIIRDLAVLVPEAIKTEEVQNIIETIGGSLLCDVDLFDYFQDEAMEGIRQKSLAFHLVFQSPERTLTDQEIEKIIGQIIKALEEKAWEVRK